MEMIKMDGITGTLNAAFAFAQRGMSESAQTLLEQAGEDIEKLQSDLAALKEQTRWIPVGEELPKIIQGCSHSKDVWVVLRKEAYKGYYDKDTGWFIYSSYESAIEYQDEVTHFMDIPQLPKE